MCYERGNNGKRRKNMWKAGDNMRGMEAKELMNGGNNTSDKELPCQDTYAHVRYLQFKGGLAKILRILIAHRCLRHTALYTALYTVLCMKLGEKCFMH